jgi:hypothetical protein
VTTWQRFFARLVTEIDRQPTVPPTGIVPGFPPLDDTPAAAELEHDARVGEALRLVEAALARESERARKTGMRNPDLVDVCLEVRSALQPSPPDAEVLREVPPVGIRYAAPVIPGRPS